MTGRQKALGLFPCPLPSPQREAYVGGMLYCLGIFLSLLPAPCSWLLGKLEVQWNAGPSLLPGKAAWPDLSALHGAEEAGSCEGLRSLGLSSGDQPLPQSYPQQETPHCFQPGRTPGVVEGGQGCGMERVEGGPAQQKGRRLLLPFWFASGFCPRRQRRRRAFWWPWTGHCPERYLQRVWVGGLSALWCGEDSGGWCPWGLEESRGCRMFR